jgi:hypothetical protein
MDANMGFSAWTAAKYSGHCRGCERPLELVWATQATQTETKWAICGGRTGCGTVTLLDYAESTQIEKPDGGEGPLTTMPQGGKA